MTGSLLKTNERHQHGVKSIAFSQDGNMIVNGYSTGTPLKTFEGYQNSLISVTFSPNGNMIVSGSSDKTIK